MLHSAARSPNSRTVIASILICCFTWTPPGFFIRIRFRIARNHTPSFRLFGGVAFFGFANEARIPA
jgi:hypothetical protein